MMFEEEIRSKILIKAGSKVLEAKLSASLDRGKSGGAGVFVVIFSAGG